MSENLRDKIRDALAEHFEGSVYVCSRHKSAWGYGTMGLDDFSHAEEDEELLYSIADQILKVLDEK